MRRKKNETDSRPVLFTIDSIIPLCLRAEMHSVARQLVHQLNSRDAVLKNEQRKLLLHFLHGREELSRMVLSATDTQHPSSVLILLVYVATQ
jgi:hypothetical protein